MAAGLGGGPADRPEHWVFGYGSLIYKGPDHHDRSVPGWITGYIRRFWQASEDHRGTPENPGRVVTLLERSHWETLADHHNEAPEKVWGVAFRIKPEKWDEVKRDLDFREKNGYTEDYATFTPADGSAPIRALVYIGRPDNPQFVGPQPVQELALHIHRSVGPSGTNSDYLLKLHSALEHLCPESGDQHIKDLSLRVLALQAKDEAAGNGRGDPSS